jgi:hypothetical protein
LSSFGLSTQDLEIEACRITWNMISNNRIPDDKMNHSCSSQHNENMRNETIRVTHTIVSDDEESQEMNTIPENSSEGGFEPLDYRRDWSQEIIHTFVNLKASLRLEQFMT